MWVASILNSDYFICILLSQLFVCLFVEIKLARGFCLGKRLVVTCKCHFYNTYPREAIKWWIIRLISFSVYLLGGLTLFSVFLLQKNIIWDAFCALLKIVIKSNDFKNHLQTQAYLWVLYPINYVQSFILILNQNYKSINACLWTISVSRWTRSSKWSN